MSDAKQVFFTAIFLSFSIFAVSGPKQERISTLLEILFAIYDYDSSQIPDEPNEIFALQNSTESREQLAWAIFEMLRSELDPNSKPFETTLSTAFEESLTPVEFSTEETIEKTEDSPPASFPRMTAMEMQPILDLYGPLGHCILMQGTYRIHTLPLKIEGHVVIPAGTTLLAPFEPNKIIIEVMPGGRLDIGRATFYEADFPAVLPPVRIEALDPNNWFVNNAVGIYVHRGADPKTRIENLILKHCTVGIIMDEQLETAIRGVITVGCYDGMHLYAPAGVINCQFWCNGSVFDELPPYVGTGIYILPDATSFPIFSTEIDRSVFHDGDVGVFIDSPWRDPNVPEPNQISVRVFAINSCFTSSYFFGVYQQTPEVETEIAYSAFGGNWQNVNFSGSFTGCIGLSYNPFYNKQEEWEKLYILPDSELTDAGYGIADDGTETAHDRPDTGILDIGCHFPLGLTGAFGIPSCPSDFNADGVVDEQDWALMMACLGATDDPNLVRMDFNGDSWVNLPDFGVFTRDFGYTADPNRPGPHDPNCARSDFNGDDWVDITDFAILAELWLTVVFDEYRPCILCNLSPTCDPNLPEVIDANDMAVFMADWGKEYTFEYAVAFASADGNSIEPNQLSGLVTLSVEECPPSTWVFVQIDGTLAGQTYADGSVPTPFEIPTYEFANGNHILTVGGYTHEDGCWIKEYPVRFDNWLYFASIPDMYEPNEIYEITGFFDSGTIEIATDPNTSTISDTGYIRHAAFISTPRRRGSDLIL